MKLKKTSACMDRLADKEYFDTLKELKEYVADFNKESSEQLYYDYYKAGDEYVLLIGYK